MEYVFAFIILCVLFDIEEKIKKITNNNTSHNKKEKQIIFEDYLNKKVHIVIDDNICNSHLFTVNSGINVIIKDYDSEWLLFVFFDKTKKKNVNQYIRIKDLISIEEIRG